MINNQPIGLFDSGIGGTSIWSAIHQLLPNEDTIYLADSKNAPYGQKTKDEILALSIKNTELLLEINAKLIVVACNTATTNAILEPAIKPAAINSKTQTIGILATKGTLNSELFNKSVESFQDIKIIEQIGYNLVNLIENGEINSPEMNQLLHSYLQPMIDADIDYLVLGCSHYPYLIPQIKKILPKKIHIIDSGEAVARQTQKIIEEKTGKHEDGKGNAIFYTNANTKVLSDILKTPYQVLYKDF